MRRAVVWLPAALALLALALAACPSLCGSFGDVVTCPLTGKDNIVATHRVVCAGGANTGTALAAFPSAKPHEIAACEDECANAFAAH